MPPVIEVKHLTKEYRLGSLTSIKDTFRQGLARLMGKKDLAWERERFKALDDVSFSIEEGEIVGIIGHNGAGKSTLLKHLANISTPTSGEVHVRGSVAPLIEVGAGLHPELTGRENIYLNGAILGIPKKEVDRKVDKIIDFSELEQFIDTPVKRYSSGMTVKLGFSIATSIESEILIVDEVLAVGDLAFQRKCFDRIERFIRSVGKTVIVVSHNMRQIQRLCGRVILLGNGRIIQDGGPVETCNAFYKINNDKIISQGENPESEKVRSHSRGTGEVGLKSFSLSDLNKKPTREYFEGESICANMEFEAFEKLNGLELICGIHTTDFVYLLAASTLAELGPADFDEGIHRVECVFNNIALVPGVYSFWFGVVDRSGRTILAEENILNFSVLPKDKTLALPGRRMFNAPSKWYVLDDC